MRFAWALQNCGFKVVIGSRFRGYLPWQLGQGGAADRSRRPGRSSRSFGTSSRSTLLHFITVDFVSKQITAEGFTPSSRLTTTPGGGCCRAWTTSGLTLRHDRVRSCDEFERRQGLRVQAENLLPCKGVASARASRSAIELFSLQHTKMCDLGDLSGCAIFTLALALQAYRTLPKVPAGPRSQQAWCCIEEGKL